MCYIYFNIIEEKRDETTINVVIKNVHLIDRKMECMGVNIYGIIDIPVVLNQDIDSV